MTATDLANVHSPYVANLTPGSIAEWALCYAGVMIGKQSEVSARGGSYSNYAPYVPINTPAIVDLFELTRSTQAPASPVSGTSSATSSGLRPSARSAERTPARSAAERFWLPLNLPTTLATSISKPTMARNIPST